MLNWRISKPCLAVFTRDHHLKIDNTSVIWLSWFESDEILSKLVWSILALADGVSQFLIELETSIRVGIISLSLSINTHCPSFRSFVHLKITIHFGASVLWIWPLWRFTVRSYHTSRLNLDLNELVALPLSPCQKFPPSAHRNC